AVVLKLGKGAEADMINGGRYQGFEKLDGAPRDGEITERGRSKNGTDGERQNLFTGAGYDLCRRDVKPETPHVAQARERKAPARSPARGQERASHGELADDLLPNEAPDPIAGIGHAD